MTRFDTTRWSVVMLAREGSASARAALEDLCRTYRPPVLAYVRHNVRDRQAAEDLVQTFFAKFLEHAWYADADPARGRFRTFLLTALKRFLIDAEQEAMTIKRGGRMRFRSLDHDGLDGDADTRTQDADSPESAFERSWALAVIGVAMRRLRSEAVGAGKQELFDQLGEFLAERPDETDYARVADALKIRRNTLAVTVHRLRHRLRALIRDELARTTATDDELESELHDLRAALGGMD